LRRKFCEKKDKNEKFYFAKVEALVGAKLPLARKFPGKRKYWAARKSFLEGN
jgi:hypothetical protein